MLEVVHDSARGAPGVGTALHELRDRRRLVGVLVRRDLALRYKRSLLGLWWTLLNPVLEAAVLFAVFSQVFRFATAEAPYSVYLLAGVVLATLLRQTVTGVATCLTNNAAILGRLRVEPLLFAASVAAVQAVGFAVAVVPVLGVMALTGTGLAATAPLALVPAVLLLLGATGIGMLLAAPSVVFADLHELVRIALGLLGYLAPVFYPVAIVPDRWRWLVDANPLTHILELFRGLLYGGTTGDVTSWVVAVAVCGAALLAGLAVFGRQAREVVAQL